MSQTWGRLKIRRKIKGKAILRPGSGGKSAAAPGERPENTRAYAFKNKWHRVHFISPDIADINNTKLECYAILIYGFIGKFEKGRHARSHRVPLSFAGIKDGQFYLSESRR